MRGEGFKKTKGGVRTYKSAHRKKKSDNRCGEEVKSTKRSTRGHSMHQLHHRGSRRDHGVCSAPHFCYDLVVNNCDTVPPGLAAAPRPSASPTPVLRGVQRPGPQAPDVRANIPSPDWVASPVATMSRPAAKPQRGSIPSFRNSTTASSRLRAHSLRCKI